MKPENLAQKNYNKKKDEKNLHHFYKNRNYKGVFV